MHHRKGSWLVAADGSAVLGERVGEEDAGVAGAERGSRLNRQCRHALIETGEALVFAEPPARGVVRGPDAVDR